MLVRCFWCKLGVRAKLYTLHLNGILETSQIILGPSYIMDALSTWPINGIVSQEKTTPLEYRMQPTGSLKHHLTAFNLKPNSASTLHISLENVWHSALNIIPI